MNLEHFIASTEKSSPPADLSIPLLALWHDARGNWDVAHETVQNEGDNLCAWIHAYLHRKEGDLWNARYWYNRSRQPEFKGSLADEWAAIVQCLLDTRKAA